MRVFQRWAMGIVVLMGLTLMWLVTPSAQQAGAGGAQVEDFSVNPARGPVDLGLTDLVLVGAIDVHAHLDPDSPGPGGQVRGIDAFDFATLAQDRGMRGFVWKNHQSPGAAQVAYLVREHLAPGLEVFGRMPLNMATGGVDHDGVATINHYAQIKGGWGRIVEMPTLDAEWGTRNETAESMGRSRPWMLLMPPEAPKAVSVSRNGELLPEVKHLIATMAQLRTVDSNGRLVLATGHSSPEEHLLLAREARQQGLQVLLTHPGNIPQLPEAAELGAFIEINAAGVNRSQEALRAAVEIVHHIGAESIVIGTDCGQMSNPYPTDCLVLAARRLRAQGIADRELDLMIKENPARLLGLTPWREARAAQPTARKPQIPDPDLWEAE